MKCNICKNNYKLPGDEPKCNRMCEDYSDFNPITNADKIKKMTDEQLARWLTKITDDAQLDARTKMDYQWLEWLKTEVKEG